MSETASSTPEQCDTLPAPRFTPSRHHRTSSLPVQFVHRSSSPPLHRASISKMPLSTLAPSQSPPRKLCVRHQRMADQGTNLKLQQVCLSSRSLTGAYPPRRPSTRFPRKNDRSSIQYGPTSLPLPTPGGSSSSRAYSQCVAFPNFPSSRNSSVTLYG